MGEVGRALVVAPERRFSDGSRRLKKGHRHGKMDGSRRTEEGFWKSRGGLLNSPLSSLKSLCSSGGRVRRGAFPIPGGVRRPKARNGVAPEDECP